MPRTNPSNTTEAEGGQLLYKLGSLGSEVRGLSETIKLGIKNLEDKIDSNSLAFTASLTAEKIRINHLDKKMDDLITWRNNLMMKGGFLVSAVSLFWVIFSDPIKRTVESVF